MESAMHGLDQESLSTVRTLSRAPGDESAVGEMNILIKCSSLA